MVVLRALNRSLTSTSAKNVTTCHSDAHSDSCDWSTWSTVAKKSAATASNEATEEQKEPWHHQELFIISQQIHPVHQHSRGASTGHLRLNVCVQNVVPDGDSWSEHHRQPCVCIVVEVSRLLSEEISRFYNFHDIDTISSIRNTHTLIHMITLQKYITISFII